MPGPAEYEGRLFIGFLDHMYHMRVVLHADHIGLAAKLAEMLGDALQIADT